MYFKKQREKKIKIKNEKLSLKITKLKILEFYLGFLKLWEFFSFLCKHTEKTKSGSSRAQ
jgi:hypothetical protein